MHRPRVYSEQLPASLFRRGGWYWRFACDDCGYHAPYGLIMTWSMALRFANTHVWAARRAEQRFDEIVAHETVCLDGDVWKQLGL